MNLIREIVDALTQMKMLSEGPSGPAPDAVRTSPSEPDYTPRLAGGSLYEDYAGPEGELTRLLYKMQRDLDRARFAGRKPEHREDRDKRIVNQYEGWPALKVAEWEGLGHQTVRDIRKRNNRNQVSGRRNAA